MSEIGERLRAAREARDLRVEQVAPRIRLTPAAVRHHENGTRAPDATQIASYAQIYKVTTDWLILGRGGGPGHDRANLFDVWDAIPPDRRPQALNILRTFKDNSSK